MKIKKKLLFERVDMYTDFLLDQILRECNECIINDEVGSFGQDEIMGRLSQIKDPEKAVSSLVNPGSDSEIVYVMPTKRAPVAAEI